MFFREANVEGIGPLTPELSMYLSRGENMKELNASTFRTIGGQNVFKGQCFSTYTSSNFDKFPSSGGREPEKLFVPNALEN